VLFQNATKIARVVEDSSWEREVVIEFISTLKSLFMCFQEHNNDPGEKELRETNSDIDSLSASSKVTTQPNTTRGYAEAVGVLDNLLSSLSRRPEEDEVA
jgi:hypothetical protein